MGFSLKHMLSPGNAVRGLFDPAGASISGLTGSKGWQSYADPSGALLHSGGKGQIDDSANLPELSGGGDYGGDTEDAGYGSFTKPFDIEEFYKYEDPGYGFRLQQGQQGVLNGASAGSGALSGAALKDLLTFNQDSASQEYNNAFNRYQTQQGNIFNRLYSLLNLGQNAASNVGAQGTQLVGNAANATANAGAAAGAGIVGAGNAASGGASDYWLYRQFGGAGG